MVDASMGYGYRAESISDVAASLELAAETGRRLAARGSGYSYGDTALNAENIVLDMTRMNRILSWDPNAGLLKAEPGVTIGDLWRRTIRDGYWPPVVPGTMHPTLGGCLAGNVHGKNNWRAGTMLDVLVTAEMMLPSGEVVEMRPDRDADLTAVAIGGLGLVGVFVSATLHLERVSSGLLEVEQRNASSLSELFDLFDGQRDAAYLVGWIDGFASGDSLGRGLVQAARHANGHPGQGFDPAEQDLPPNVFGIVPRAQLWRGMKLTVNDTGMRALNAARFASGALGSGRRTLTPLARFHFFHDYVPNWKWSFRPGGILQYQVFAPKATASALFADLLRRGQEEGLVPYLVVMKAHREDAETLLAYNLDGYSLSLDFHATPANVGRLRAVLARWTDDLVAPAGGRFYLAKDSVLSAAQTRRMWGDERVDEFISWKRRLDPQHVLQTDLYRRVFRS